MSHFYVIAYDVPDDKRRTKLFQLLREYGDGAQLSFFECFLTEVRFAELKTRLLALADPEEDDFRFYEVCAACRKRAVTVGEMPNLEQPRTFLH
jgi:CRISPR-associated protein Cas2